MNTRRTAVRRVGQEIANAGATPQGNRNAPQVQAAANDQVPVNPPAMTDGEVRAALFQMTQTIMSQANRKVVPRENQHASIMVSRLKDFTRMNPPMFLGSKVDETPRISLMRSIRSLFHGGEYY